MTTTTIQRLLRLPTRLLYAKRPGAKPGLFFCVAQMAGYLRFPSSFAFIRPWLWLGVAFAVSGCSSGSPLATAKDLVFYAWNPDTEIEQARLDPRFAYARVEHEGRLSLLALAYEESKNSAQARRQVFVSGSKETLIIEQGVIRGFSSVSRQWVMQKGQVTVQPGYQLLPAMSVPETTTPPPSVESKLYISPSGAPTDFVWQSIPGGWAAFQSSKTLDSTPGPWLFTYQCLQENFCLAVQAWSASLQEQVRLVR